MNSVNKKYPECIIWDWNGTLIDDFPICLEIVNRMLDRRGMKRITAEQYYSYMDTPIIKFYENVFDLNVVTFDMIAKEYNTDYSDFGVKASLSPNVLETVMYFKEKGVRQVIMSASHISYIETTSKRLGVYELFDSIIAADDFHSGSKIERAENYFKENNIDPETAVVIGDTRHDMDMARALSAKCLMYSGGHEGREKLERAGGYVCDIISRDEILTALNR